MAAKLCELGIKKCHLYTRVSTEKQSEFGQSLDDQLTKLRNWCQSNSLDVERVFCEPGVSGGKSYKERPQLSELISNIKKGELLAIASLDRLGRSVSDVLNICEIAKKSGWYIWFHNLNILYPSDMFSEMLITLMSSVSQIERNLIAERARSSWQYRKENGFIKMKPWFMREADTELETFKRQQIVDTVKNLYQEAFSFTYIADHLNKMKFQTNQKKKFYGQTVKNIIDYLLEVGELKRRRCKVIPIQG